MELMVNGHSIFVIVLTTFLASLGFTFLIKKIAISRNILDVPNERSAHTKPTPLLGGIGIFLGFLFGFILFGNHNSIMISILIASFLILLLGIFDDIKPIPAKYKFLVHILVAAIIVFYGNLKLEHFDIFDFSLTDEEMAKISLLDKGVRYYTSTPEMLKKYVEMKPPVDEQK